MPEITDHRCAETLLRILRGTYGQYPWKAEGDPVPVDIAMDPSGILPVWWNQVERTAALLDIPADDLPAKIVEDGGAITGKRLEWRDGASAPTAGRLLLRAILPAIAMDAMRVLHQQENVLDRPRHLDMFPESSSIVKNLTDGCSARLLMEPLADARERLPIEAETAGNAPDVPAPAIVQ